MKKKIQSFLLCWDEGTFLKFRNIFVVERIEKNSFLHQKNQNSQNSPNDLIKRNWSANFFIFMLKCKMGARKIVCMFLFVANVS